MTGSPEVIKTRSVSLPHLMSRVFGTPLMIQPEKLDVILGVLGPRFGAGAAITADVFEDDDQELTDGSKPRKIFQITPQGIAVIPVSGTLVKKSSWMDAWSGMRSYASISTQFAAAVNDQDCRGILLDIDSPGGEVAGLFDLCDQIMAARSEKPVYAIANDNAFSAAYAIASSAEKLFVTRTGGVGSVGVIALHLDQSAMDKSMGLKYTAIYAGARKNDLTPHEPLSDDARTSLQSEVDRLYSMFTSMVATSRGLKQKAVQATEAGLYFGENGINVRLADTVGTFQDALDSVTQASQEFEKKKSSGPTIPQQPLMAAAEKPEIDTQLKTVDSQPEIQITSRAQAETPAANSKEEIMADKPNETQTAAVVAEVKPEAKSIPASVSKADIEEISALCALAGVSADKALKFISAGTSIADVRSELLALRQKAAGPEINSAHTASTSSTAEAQLESAAKDLSRSKGITKERAMVTLLADNPGIYRQYLAEHPAQAVSSR